MTLSLDRPLYFAWADETETTFGPEHLIPADAAGSLEIVSLTKEQGEGEACTITLETRNPRVPLLSQPKIWGWSSIVVDQALEEEDPPDLVVKPIGFGRLVAIPKDLIGEGIMLEFICMPSDLLLQQQRLAETLKVPPFYDPLGLDPSKRDDPNAILEGYGYLWDIDPVDHVVRVVDILGLNPESDDTEEVFTSDEVPYDSVKEEIDTTPLPAIRVELSVQWNQNASGIVPFGTWSIETYAGQSLLSDWPKPLANLGGGWKVKSANAIDAFGVNNAITYNARYKWHNTEKTHHIGDTMEVDVSESKPLLIGAQQVELTRKIQIGVISPDPDEMDVQPASVHLTYLYVPKWHIDGSLTLAYGPTQRQRTEKAVFTVVPDVQALVPHQAFPTEETIIIGGVDVGAPLIDILDWLTVRDTDVKQSQIIYTGYPDGTLPNSYQIAKNAGHAGAGDEPTFPVDAGAETIDGGVTWISLGPNFTINSINWTAGTYVRVGQLLLPEIDDWAYWPDLVPAPRLTGTSVSEGTIVRASDNSSFHFANVPGETGLGEPGWPTTYGAVTIDGDVEWICLGTHLPAGDIYFIATSSFGLTNINYLPDFSYTIGDETTDGTVTWKCIGRAEDFAPLPIGDPSRRSFFPTARGLQFLEYGISLGRAKARKRARSAKLSWDVPIERALDLNCRKTATLIEDRISGGSATGKITHYVIHHNNGDTGECFGTVTIGAAIGKGGSVADVAGTPAYIEDGVIEDAPIVPGTDVHAIASDIGYSRPIDQINDDGLVFPLTPEQVVLVNQVRGNIGLQAAAVADGIMAAKQMALLEETSAGNITPQQAVILQQKIAGLGKRSIETQLSKAKNAIWLDLQLRPADNGPFNDVFNVSLTQLQIAQQIDLGEG